MHCWSIRFHTFLMFHIHLNVGYDNDDVEAYVT